MTAAKLSFMALNSGELLIHSGSADASFSFRYVFWVLSVKLNNSSGVSWLGAFPMIVPGERITTRLFFSNTMGLLFRRSSISAPGCMLGIPFSPDASRQQTASLSSNPRFCFTFWKTSSRISILLFWMFI